MIFTHSLRQIAHNTVTYAGSMSQSKNKNSVLIKWKTKDHWCDKEQYIKRGSIDPEDGSLEKGRVKVLFSRRWYDAEVSEAWIAKTQKTRPRK